MNPYYKDTRRAAELYAALQDDVSRELFWARLRYDLDPSIDSMLRLFGLATMLSREEMAVQMTCRETLKEFADAGKKILLYGAGMCGLQAGRAIAKNIDFYGFCDRNHEKFPNGFLGKPVYSPEYLFAHSEDCYVIITTMDHSLEIFDFLKENGFPEGHILPYFNKLGTSFAGLIDRQYFDFPELYPKHKAFVDGGCFDCGTSIRFAEWCGGAYSKIFAFEPDPENFKRSQAAAERYSLGRIEFIPAGLSDRSGFKYFMADGSSSTYAVSEDAAAANGPENFSKLNVAALDDIVKDCKVGFIKMDIEGEEYHALQGAKHTLLRDRPLLAICVYHRQGDVLAIMDYLHDLIPEYRFWLRHYTPFTYETVLYASI